MFAVADDVAGRFPPAFSERSCCGYDWHEAQRAGLGEEFLSAVQSTVSNIEAYSGEDRKVNQQQSIDKRTHTWTGGKRHGSEL
jgi:hypothetical protein